MFPDLYQAEAEELERRLVPPLTLDETRARRCHAAAKR
jgi:hypothetical protein